MKMLIIILGHFEHTYLVVLNLAVINLKNVIQFLKSIIKT